MKPPCGQSSPKNNRFEDKVGTISGNSRNFMEFNDQPEKIGGK